MLVTYKRVEQHANESTNYSQQVRLVVTTILLGSFFTFLSIWALSLVMPIFQIVLALPFLCLLLYLLLPFDCFCLSFHILCLLVGLSSFFRHHGAKALHSLFPPFLKHQNYGKKMHASNADLNDLTKYQLSPMKEEVY